TWHHQVAVRKAGRRKMKPRAGGKTHTRASSGRGFSPAVPTRLPTTLGNVGTSFAAGLKPSHPRALAPTPIYHRRASGPSYGRCLMRPLVSFMSSGSAEASRPLSQKGVFNGQHHAVRGKISLVHLYAGDYRLLAPDSVALERAKGYLSSDHG